MKTGSAATGTSTRFDAMIPEAIQQVPLDRVTQTIYARIYAAMAPLQKEMQKVQASASILTGVFAKFRESLPSLDAPAYEAMREQLAVVSQGLKTAFKVPLSITTRTLAAQLVLHDLPRLAAIAVKLNEEEAPKFFAAINYTDSTFETFAVDTTKKTTIRKADLETAIQNIVSKRVSDFERLVKEDTAKWFAAKGIVGDTLTIEHDAAMNNVTSEKFQEYVFRHTGDFWEIVYEGRRLQPVRHLAGMTYIHALLLRPGKDISAIDLYEIENPPPPQVVAPPKSSAMAPEEREKYGTGGSHQTILDKTTPAKLKKAHAALKAKLTDPDLSEKQREHFEDQQAAIETALSSGRVARGTGGMTFENKATKQPRQAVSKSIEAAFDALAKMKHAQELVKHLRYAVRKGNTFMYPPGLTWQT